MWHKQLIFKYNQLTTADWRAALFCRKLGYQRVEFEGNTLPGGAGFEEGTL
jgi:hypothetical protein